jgi:hypothetical protein
MSNNDATPTFEVGDLISGVCRVMTHERVVWYGDALMTASAGERRQTRTNIHTDDEFARQQGFAGSISDGMISTNWISSMLLRAFGRSYVENGELRTKFIHPTSVGSTVSVFAKVRAKSETPDGGTRYELDAWTEDEHGTKLTDAEAFVTTLATAQLG